MTHEESEWKRRYDASLSRAEKDLGDAADPWDQIGMRLIIGLVGGAGVATWALLSSSNGYLRALGITILVGAIAGAAIAVRAARRRI
jgi:hypothetical protein